MSLERDIAAWNGKSADPIAAIFHSYQDAPHFIETVIELVGRSASQNGATWLLKAWLDNGRTLTLVQNEALFDHLDILDHWEARLHMLQSLPYLEIGAAKTNAVEHFLTNCLAAQNKFVRAWAYNGFYVLSTQHPKYTEKTLQLFEIAMRDEAASVKARIRNLIRTGF